MTLADGAGIGVYAPPSSNGSPRLAPRRGARLVAIGSGKGGVGKTWLTITLAQALAEHVPGARVLVVDGDLGLANVDVQLGLVPGADLAAVFAGRATLADAICRCDAGGFDVLPGRSGTTGLAGLGRERLEMLLRGLAALPYEVVLLDLGAGIDAHTRQLAARSDLLLVLTTDEPTSLTDAYAVLKLHAADHPGAEARLIVNQARSAEAGARTHAALQAACQRFLGRAPALAGVVRRDERVPDAIRKQMPLLARHPASPAGADVRAIAREMVRHLS